MHLRDEGTGRPLLLLHAFPCDGTLWSDQARACREVGWRTLVPDLPGFGRSNLLPGEPRLDDVVDAVARAVQDIGLDQIVVGGVSLGGYVAMGLVRRHPSLVSALLLCDTKASADTADARAGRERLAGLCESEPDQTGRILNQAVLPGLLGSTTHEARPAVVERTRGYLDRADARTVAWYQRAMAQRPDSHAALEGWAGPALVLWGAEDVLSPDEDQERLLGALFGSRRARLPGVGHLAIIEDPDGATTEILAFLATLREA
jgi:pimeloyl-ACP methyl ester carboxylesterase